MALSKLANVNPSQSGSTATAVRTMASWPFFAEDEIRAVDEVLRSGKVNFWTGEQCRAFEREYAAYVGTKHGIAAANGSVTLEMALRAYGIGAGDEVVVSPRSYVASVSCVILCGATPVFADVDRDSGNLTAESIRSVLSPRTKAIIPVHLAGWPCDMDSIMALAEQHGLIVIEDCAQAHGATYKGRQVGSIGAVASFSFCQDKILTTGGEGGMITTNGEDAWQKMWSFKEHGKNFDSCFNKVWPPGYRWLHDSIGTNARMTEMQAALGRVILRKLPAWLAARRANATRFIDRLSPYSVLRIPVPPRELEHAYYKFLCYVRPERLRAGWSRDRIIQEINAQGLPCFSGGCSEIYLEKAFLKLGLGPAHRLPGAKELGETTLMFLVHPTLNPDDISFVCDAVCRVLDDASA